MVGSRQSLRILHVNTTDVFGGAESSMLNLHHGYRARGHESWVAVGFRFSQDPHIFLMPNHQTANPWSRLWWRLDAYIQWRWGHLRGTRRLGLLARRLAAPGSLVDKYRGVENFRFPGAYHLPGLTPTVPDLIHCHNLHGDYFDLRALPQLSQRLPVILNLRDAWLLSGHCAHSFDCERWRTGCGHCPYLDTYPPVRRDATAFNWQRKASIYRASRLYITAPSQWLLDKVKTSMLVGVQYRVIPNAIDVEVFTPGNKMAARHALGLPAKARVVLLTAHNMFKDYATMEAALARLVKQEEGELLFICLGTVGQDKVVGAGRMIYPGFERNPARVAMYYRAADVFIHAAKDEAFGKTVAEAMATGVPVVATAVGGITEQLTHGHTGFLVPPADSAAMAAIVQQLLDNPELAARISQAGPGEARRRFGLTRQIGAFLDWYREILEEWPRGEVEGVRRDVGET